MSSRICGQVLDSTLTGNMRWVALVIADAADADGEAVMKIRNIVEGTRLSVNTIRAMMRRMEEVGILTVTRDPGGRIQLMRIHPAKLDGSKLDGSKLDGSKLDGSKLDGSKLDGSGDAVSIGKSQEESGLQDSDGDGAGAKDGESGASAPSLPFPCFPPSDSPLLSPTLSSPDIPERVEGEDARRGNQFGVAQVTMFDEAAEIAGRAKASKGPMVKPGKTEVMAFVLSMGLEPEDGEYIFENWEAGGWTRNGKPIKDWRACCRAWKAGRYFPSQKASTGRGGVVRGYRKIDYSKGF